MPNYFHSLSNLCVNFMDYLKLPAWPKLVIRNSAQKRNHPNHNNYLRRAIWKDIWNNIWKEWTMHTVRLTILLHVFLELWLVNTWFFAHWRHQRAVTRLENVRHLNKRDKKLGFQLSHRQHLWQQQSKNLWSLVLSYPPRVRIMAG